MGFYVYRPLINVFLLESIKYLHIHTNVFKRRKVLLNYRTVFWLSLYVYVVVVRTVSIRKCRRLEGSQLRVGDEQI